MLYHAAEKQLQLDGLQLDYITFGTGPKPLVMIQGLNTRPIRGMALPLAWMYRLFARHYTVYLFDRRPVAAEGVTVRELAQDIAMAMDALGISGAHVLGVSQGGMIAQYLAIDRPDLVSRLVLALTLSRSNETVVSVVSNWITLCEQGNMKQLVQDMAVKMYSAAYVKRYRPFMPLLAVWQKPRNVQHFTALASACLNCDTYDRLHRIQCPVFVIGARQDQVVGAEASEELARKLNCELWMYEELGHAAYEEAKDFNRRILAFLQA